MAIATCRSQRNPGCYPAVPTAVHQYLSPSLLTSEHKNEGLRLGLASRRAEGESDEAFFQGLFLRPRLTARAMRVLSRVAAERWFDARAIAAARNLDPVVTSGCGHLRLEAFSGCRSLYARLDLTPDSLEVGHERRGTTNVDFNEELRNAFGRVRDSHQLSACVSEDSFIFVHGERAILEKKVDLPDSWLRGFASVQSLAPASEPFATVGKRELQRLFQQFPTTGDGREGHWIHPSPTGLRVGRIASDQALPLTGLRRLQCLRELVPFADELTIHRHPSGALSLWTLIFDGLRFTLGLSAEVWRGFSGEGAALADLADDDQPPDLDERIQAQLAGREPCDPGDLAIALDCALPDIRSALARLASQGLVGFDHVTGHCFERVLPGSEELVDRSNPRLEKARKWVAEGKVSLEPDREGRGLARATVGVSSDTAHQVVIEDDTDIARCTCYWHGRFGNTRGPCSHILATRLALQQRSSR